ncbi:hypothetical protein ACQ4PT_060291 [Festuca glaucescens]
MAAALLPEDVLLEILVRVKDAAALFRGATACKPWCRLVSDPSFLLRCWPNQDVSSSFVGFFTAQQHDRVEQQHDGEGLLPVSDPCFIPTPRSPLGPGRRTISSFVAATPPGLFDQAVPLASRHGLLLVLLEMDETGGYPEPRIVHLQQAVCKLLVGTCDMLPPLKYPSGIGASELSGYDILTGADCQSNDESLPWVLPSNSSLKKFLQSGNSHHQLRRPKLGVD